MAFATGVGAMLRKRYTYIYVYTVSNMRFLSIARGVTLINT